MSDFSKIMEQAKKMQEKIFEEQQRLSEVEVLGSSGGGLVQVTMTCKNVIKSVKIDPSLVVPEEVTILEDLVIAAMNDALSKCQEKAEEGFGDLLPSGLNLFS